MQKSLALVVEHLHGWVRIVGLWKLVLNWAICWFWQFLQVGNLYEVIVSVSEGACLVGF